MVEIICKRCDINFDATSRHIHYCQECRKIRTSEIEKKTRDKNKEKRNEHNKEYRKTHKNEIATRMQSYNKTYKETHRLERKEYRKNKKETDINYKIELKLRNKFHTFFKSNKDNYNDLFGCTTNQFNFWIESSFKHDMNWENYGKLWHIDHVIPVSIFDLTNDFDIKFCFNWKNTRPLYSHINVSRKYSFHDILIHEMKTINFQKENKFNNHCYGVSYISSHSRNRLMDLVNC